MKPLCMIPCKPAQREGEGGGGSLVGRPSKENKPFFSINQVVALTYAFTVCKLSDRLE